MLKGIIFTLGAEFFLIGGYIAIGVYQEDLYLGRVAAIKSAIPYAVASVFGLAATVADLIR